MKNPWTFLIYISNAKIFKSFILNCVACTSCSLPGEQDSDLTGQLLWLLLSSSCSRSILKCLVQLFWLVGTEKSKVIEIEKCHRSTQLYEIIINLKMLEIYVLKVIWRRVTLMLKLQLTLLKAEAKMHKLAPILMSFSFCFRC